MEIDPACDNACRAIRDIRESASNATDSMELEPVQLLEIISTEKAIETWL
jgi:hypothetical protein